MKVKENVIQDYLEMIKKSWTWAKLTDEEKECFEKFLAYHPMVEEAVKGNYLQRWHSLEPIYHAFLMGCGYHNQLNWRENN